MGTPTKRTNNEQHDNIKDDKDEDSGVREICTLGQGHVIALWRAHSEGEKRQKVEEGGRR